MKPIDFCALLPVFLVFILKDVAANSAFVPTNYIISLRPIVDQNDTVGEQYTVPGQISIVGKLVYSAKEIQLDSKNITINESSISIKSIDPPYQHNVTKLDNHPERIILHLQSEVAEATELEVTMNFVAEMTPSCEYRTSRICYTNHDFKDGLMIVGGHPRGMFPSVLPNPYEDTGKHPTIQLTIFRKNVHKTTSISNALLEYSKPDENHDGWTLDHFSPTSTIPITSLFFFVSPFAFKEAHFGSKSLKVILVKPMSVGINIYAPDRLIESNGQYYQQIADTTAKLMSSFETYFNNSKILPKMDIILTPSFPAASTSWGIDVYNDQNFVADPKINKTWNLLMTLRKIAAGLSYKWLKDWNNLHLPTLTLKTALSEIVKYKAMQSLNLSEVVTNENQQWLATLLTQPPPALKSYFVHHQKCLIQVKMLEDTVGPSAWRTGLLSMLSKLEKSSNLLLGKNLLQSVTTAGVDEGRIATGTKLLRDLPDEYEDRILTVGVVNKSHITLSRLFLQDYEQPWPDVSVSIWKNDDSAPVNKTTEIVWLYANMSEFVIAHNSSDLMFVNVDGYGFYRTLYDPFLLKNIQHALEQTPDIIPSQTKARLLDDYFEFAKHVNGTEVAYPTVLNLTKSAIKDMNPFVWSTFLLHWNDLIEQFTGHPEYSSLSKYFGPVMNAAWSKIGVVQNQAYYWPSLFPTIGALLPIACKMNTAECMGYAKNLFYEWKSQPGKNPIPIPEQSSTLLCTMIQSGGLDEYNFIWDKYLSNVNQTKKYFYNVYIEAMSCSKDANVIKSLLDKILEKDSSLTSNDAMSVLIYTQANPVGQPIFIDFISANFEKIIEKMLPTWSRPVESFWQIVFSNNKIYYSPEHFSKLEGFVSIHKETLEPTMYFVNRTISELTQHATWVESTGEGVLIWNNDNL